MTAIAILAAFFLAGAAYEATPNASTPAQTAAENLPSPGVQKDENVARYEAFLERLTREARAREPAVVYWVVRDENSGTWRPAPGPIAPEQK